jgi:hypothetical protein
MPFLNKTTLVVVVVIAAVVLGRYGCYYLDQQYDTYRRPWAYSNDPNKPLLVGKWKGTFRDPDQIDHNIQLEIFEPLSDAKRKKRFFEKRIKRDRSSKTFFEGMALIESQGRRDSFEVWGGMEKWDSNDLHFQMRPVHEPHPPGFNLNECKGTWMGNTIQLRILYSWFRPDGSSFYSSEDPRHNTDGNMVLERVR